MERPRLETGTTVTPSPMPSTRLLWRMLRVEHLQTLSTLSLICQGTRDPFGRSDEVATYGFGPAIQLAWIEDGNHSLNPRKQSGRTREQGLQQAADALVGFVRELGM